MKTIMKFVGGLVCLIVLVIGGIKGYTAYWAAQYETTAVPYIKMVIPELSKWDPDIIKSYMPEDALKTTPEEDIIKIVDYLSKLGALKSLEEPQFDEKYTGTLRKIDNQTIVTYTVGALYEQGDAVVTMGLLVQGDSFKVNNFNINSPALLK